MHAIKQTSSYPVEKNVMDTNFPDSNLQTPIKNFCPVIIFLQIYPKEIIRYRQRCMYRSVNYALFIKVKNWTQTKRRMIKFTLAYIDYAMQ